jgi:ferritin-like protein
MASNSESYHEPFELLSDETRDMHRALVSVMEELEAIDWYQQRAEACSDDELKEILLHNKNEEMEHAMMGIEWIRRHSSDFDEKMKTYLFTSSPITQIESAATGGGSAAQSGSNGSLGIGSLKRRL